MNWESRRSFVGRDLTTARKKPTSFQGNHLNREFNRPACPEKGTAEAMYVQRTFSVISKPSVFISIPSIQLNRWSMRSKVYPLLQPRTLSRETKQPDSL